MFDEKQVKKMKKFVIADMKSVLNHILENFKDYVNDLNVQQTTVQQPKPVKAKKAKKVSKAGRPKKQ